MTKIISFSISEQSFIFEISSIEKHFFNYKCLYPYQGIESCYFDESFNFINNIQCITNYVKTVSYCYHSLVKPPLTLSMDGNMTIIHQTPLEAVRIIENYSLFIDKEIIKDLNENIDRLKNNTAFTFNDLSKFENKIEEIVHNIFLKHIFHSDNKIVRDDVLYANLKLCFFNYLYDYNFNNQDKYRRILNEHGIIVK